jgi:DNA-binding transcriptional LysR family regulator
MPATHPLARKPEILPGDLVGFPLLMPKTGATRRRLSVWLEPVEDDINWSMELDSTEMIKRFVLAGLGISFLAGTHCHDEVASGRLAAVSLGPEPMVRQLALIYRKDKALSKAALGFIEVTLRNAAVDTIVRVPVKTASTMERVAKAIPAEN